MPANGSTRIALTTFSGASLSRFAGTDVEEVLAEVDREANTFIHVVLSGPGSCEKVLAHFGLPHVLAEYVDDEADAPELDTSSDRYLFKRIRFIERVAPEGAARQRTGSLIRGSESDRFTESSASFVVGDRFVLLFEHEPASPLVARAIETVLQRERELRERGIEYFLYRLAKAVLIDNYLTLMRQLLDRLQELEEPLLAGSADSTLYHEVARVRRELNPFERSLLHVTEFTGEMTGEKPAVQGGLGYLAARLEHDCARLGKEFSMLRDRTSELIETYRDNVNTQLNNIMRSLTVLSVTFMPVSFIASFYGMNFPDIPAFRWSGGFPLAVLLMLALLVGSLTYARRKKWL
jgi:magnesium transporter